MWRHQQTWGRFAVAGRCLLLAGLVAICGCPATPPPVEEAPLNPVVVNEPPAQDSPAREEPQRDEPQREEPPVAESPTKETPEEGHEEHPANRLADETSPYLLLHAHNPVDWYPWGEEAFAKAKKENKPIFLSVGYSSCYWCHVMERESFMDGEIAKYLNENYVCIKVDREERPDVDEIYMTAVHALGQRGGWPLSVFTTPEGKPFFGGTYWPARKGDRGASIGFLGIVRMVNKAWADKQELIEEDAKALSAAVNDRLQGQQLVDELKLTPEIIDEVTSDLQDEFDPKWGGFGYSAVNPRQPKFPEPSNLMFLIERIKRKDIEDWEEAREMLTFSLDKMMQGGIYDHLGGGFHRYSTDRYWRIPHFEKMLYDNGQLATVYAEAYALTGNEEYRLVVIGILEFIQREMMDEGGAFYAALDAETDAEEGKFYRWTKEELDEHLSDADRALFGDVYNLNGEPNFEEEYYVPLLTKSLSEHASERGLKLPELVKKLQPTRERLLLIRNQRERPLTDTKILTSWNGMMIRGFADAARLLKNDHYLDVAMKAESFISDKLQTKDGRLLRTYTAGEAKLNGYLDDYAFLTDARVALHKARQGPNPYLTASRKLTDKQLELFWDKEGGGFFFTSDDHEALIARAKDPVDNVIPSGNSVSVGNLLYLAEHPQPDAPEEPPAYRERAHETIAAAGVYLRVSPGAVPRLAIHVAEYLASEEGATEEGVSKKDDAKRDATGGEAESPPSTNTDDAADRGDNP